MENLQIKDQSDWSDDISRKPWRRSDVGQWRTGRSDMPDSSLLTQDMEKEIKYPSQPGSYY